MRAATRTLALAALVLVGACTAPAGHWRVADGPWEDGSVVLESPDGALLPACLEDALCDDSQPEFPR